MKITKYLVILFLVTCLFQFQPVSAKNRRKPVPMNQLTDPSSPSYVPYPYPKNRKEIIADLLYAIDKVHRLRPGQYIAGRRPKTIDIYLNLLEKNPVYRVGKIIKVKNRRHSLAHDHIWLILIENLEGQNVAAEALHKNGLLIGGSAILPEHDHNIQKSENEALTIVSEFIGKPIDFKQIKRMERMSFGPGSIGGFTTPAWEIELKNGNVFFYTTNRGMVYGIKEKKKWKIKSDGHYEPYRQLIPQDADGFLFETLSDQIIILKKYKRKK